MNRDRPATPGRFTRSLLKPHVLLLLSALLSLLAWIIPTEGLPRGFSDRSSTDLFAICILAVWYATAALVVLLGYRLGRGWRQLTGLAATPNETIYRRLTVIAAIGVAYSWARVLLTVDVGAALTESAGNALAGALPEGAGVQTLRYVSALSAAVAIDRWIRRRGRPDLSLVLNVILLGMTATLSSRLILVMTVLITLYLRSRDKNFRGIRPLPGIVIGLALFLATAWLNYIRNANYYRVLGVQDPLQMNLSEVLTYVGTPTQTALGVAHAIGNGTLPDPLAGMGSALSLAIPTYLPSPTNSFGIRYSGLVDVASNLTTNSVFADVGSRYGLLGLGMVLLMMFGAALMAGHFSNYDNYVILAAGVLLYAFAEVWRVYLFNAGVLHALVLATLIASFPLTLRGRAPTSAFG